MLLIYIAFILDFIIGDLKWTPNPYSALKKMIIFLKKPIFIICGNGIFGVLSLIVSVILFTLIIVLGPIFIAEFAIDSPDLLIVNIAPMIASEFRENSNIISVAITLFWLYAGFSIRSLGNKGKDLYNKLKNDNTKGAQVTLSGMVDFDCNNLAPVEIRSSAISFIADRSINDIVTPLLFAAVGGPPLLWLFKAISACRECLLPNEVKNEEQYAILQSLDYYLNVISTKISIILYPIAAFILNLSYESSYNVAIRDGQFHHNPNCGIPEAAVAGALEVKLGGPVEYNGTVKERVWIGEEFNDPRLNDVKRSLNLMWVLALVLILMLSVFIYFFPMFLKFLTDTQRASGSGG
jgi:adenosylcobinamide-phosphate synthase